MPTGIVSQPPSERNRTAEASCSEVMNEKSEPDQHAAPDQRQRDVAEGAQARVAPTLAAASSIERCTSSSEA